MTIVELKQAILDKTLSNDFLILVCPENYFIANQYIEAICQNNCLELNPINSIFEPSRSAMSIITDNTTNLNILKIDTFDEVAEDYSIFQNTVVICKQVDKRIEEATKQYCVLIPKLEAWQLSDYINVHCTGLDQDECDFLVRASNNDIYKIDNEVNKLELFDAKEQKLILSNLRFTRDTDFVSIPSYDLTDAIIKKDIKKLGYCIYYRNNCDFEPTGIITQLLKKYTSMLYLSTNSGLSLAQLKISSGQAYYLKKDAALYTVDELRRKIKFVTSFDQKLKFGKIDIDKANQIDYIIANLMALN